MQEHAISLNAVRFRWRPELPDTLSIPELSIGRGEKVFLHGPSGSGKSTLLNLLAGVAVPQSGKVVVLDRDLASMSGSARDALRAERLGFIFQMFNLVPYLSLVENVLLPCRFSTARRRRTEASGNSAEEEARRLLGAMGLDSDTLEGRRVSRLSSGQQQRVAAARALIGAPDIVIADEPTSALDGAARDGFLDLLLGEADKFGTTVVFVSHDAALRGAFDRSIALAEINVACRTAEANP